MISPTCSHCHTVPPGPFTFETWHAWKDAHGWINSTGGRLVCDRCIGPSTPKEKCCVD